MRKKNDKSLITTETEGLIPIGDVLRQQGFAFQEPSPVKTRLIEGALDIRSNPPEEISYQHSVLCQTGLPYRHTAERRPRP
jgi:hypothetical protein